MIGKFRLLVSAFVATWLLGIALDLMMSGPSAYLPDPGWSWLTTVVWYGLFIFQMVLLFGSTVGLYLLRWWGRLLALIGVVYGTVMSGIVSGYEETGFGAMAGAASGYLLGAILGVAYLAPPVSEAFRRRRGDT